MFFLDHIWLIPLLPAFGAAIMFFFGRKLQKATVSAVCVGSIVLAFVMACGAVSQYSAWSSTPENFHKPYQTVLCSAFSNFISNFTLLLLCTT